MKPALIAAIILAVFINLAPRSEAQLTPNTTSDVFTSQPSGGVQAAQRLHNRVFAAYVVLLVLTVLATYFVWSSGNRVQEAIQRDADARIAAATALSDQANTRSRNLEQQNLILSGSVAGLEKDAANAKAAQQMVETQLAKQQEKTAVAEHSLLQLRESLKERKISSAQREAMIKALTKGPKGPVEIWWITSESDAYPLVLQLQEILRTSGWPEATDKVLMGGSGVGFFMAIHDHNSVPPHAEELLRGLALAGFTMSPLISADSTIPIGTVRIYIGQRTPVQ